MSNNGISDGEAISAVFENLANLEKDFASVEIDALRRKEYTLKPLYAKRQKLTDQIPSFWPSVIASGPEELQTVLAPNDFSILSAIKSLSIDRYQIESESDGEPRSLRFTFEFETNELFENKTIVKDFEFKSNDEGSGSLVSKPVSFKWKKVAKKTGISKLLDLALDLHSAEDALTSGQPIEDAEREGLWQYEKLREELEKQDEDSEMEPSFLHWFGYRGPVAEQCTKCDNDEEEEEEEDDHEHMLDVEIFPAGEEVAIALAEDLWPNVLDYFMSSQTEDVPDFSEDEVNVDDLEDAEEDIPQLVEVEVEEADPTEPERPRKKQKKA